jgi:uncharacterized protein (TIGR03067 family)
MSGTYAEFVETEVLPLVERECKVKLTKDPDGRATMGCSSGASCAMIMAWYHPEWYHRVLSYSGTFVNQQWPWNPETPGGAWDFHERLIPNSPKKPLRIWLEISDRDLLNPNVMRDNMHDWVLANQRMAKVLAEKAYEYQFVFARNAGHCDRAVKEQTLPEALEYLWKGYKPEADKDAAAAGDLALLQGKWIMTTGVADGFSIPEAMARNFTRMCKGDELTVSNGEQLIMKARITIDHTKSPKTIDYDVTDGPAKGKKHLGIYELEGDTLKSCFGAPNAPRPGEFKSVSGDRRTFSTWTRGKKE